MTQGDNLRQSFLRFVCYSSKYISIRRFLALPRAVSLSPIGLVSAKPLIVSLPFCRLVSPTRKSATEAALAAERSKFDLNVCKILFPFDDDEEGLI